MKMLTLMYLSVTENQMNQIYDKIVTFKAEIKKRLS